MPFARPPALARWIAAALFAALPLGALANDSTASLATGDLVLVPNGDIRLVQEDLYLSPDKVRVRYLFENTGPRPITTVVAFPLPPIDLGGETNYGFYPGDPVDVIGFRLWIDDRRVPVSIDARATGTGGRDVTDLLAKWGLPVTTLTPDNESAEDLRDRLNSLPPEAVAELRRAGALHGPDFGEGNYESWTAHISYYWPMTFPPRKVVEVRHTYAPVPTMTFFVNYDIEAGTYARAACTDDSFLSAARRRLAAAPSETLSATILHYVLTTANNWRGPIGRFHLTVDKKRTDALVSLCRDGIRKTGPTTFEWDARNWKPTRDLTVLFVKPLEN